jgi:hypothetical protein
VVGALAAAFLLAAAPVASASDEVEFRLLPGGAPTTEIALPVPSGESSASVVVFAGHTGDRPLDVQLLPQLAGGTLTVLDAADQVARSVTLPPVSDAAALQLRVTTTKAGRYEGFLLVLENGRVRGRLTVVVAKATDTGLRLEGADNGKVTVDSLATEFERTFRVLSSARAATPVRLRVSPLTDPLSAQVPTVVTVDGRPYRGEELTVPAQGELAFTVSAELPVGGDHRGTVAVTYGGEPLLVDLSIRRTRVAPSVAVEPIATVQSRMRWGFRPTDVDLRLLLRETNGQRVVLDAPALASLTRDARGGSVAARFDDVRLLVGGRPVTAVRLEPSQALEVTLRIANLAEPGKYTGSLRVASPDGSALTSPIAILLHQGMLMAGLAILLGVLISVVLRWYLVSYRPALTSQLRLSRLAESLETALRQLVPIEQELPVVAAVKEQIATLRLQYLRRERSGEDDLTAAADKATGLPRWIRLRRRVGAAGDPPAWTGQLSIIVAYLLADLTDPRRADLLAKADAAFKSLEEQTAPAATLTRALDDLSADAGSRPNVRAHIEAARAKMKDDRIQEAAGEYAQARLVLARELMAELDRITSAAQGAVPAGVDPAEWDALRSTVANAVKFVSTTAEPEEAESTYRDAARELLGTLIKGMGAAVVSLRQSIKPATLDAGKEKLASAKDALGETDTAWTAGNLPEAQRRYEQTRTAYEEARKLILPASRMGGKPLPATVAAPAVSAERQAWRYVPGTEAGREPVLPSAHRIRGQRLVLDGATNVVILLVAVGLGLYLLFVPDAAWGGVEDWLTAILWGLGLHQIGDSAFSGFSGLRGQFARTGPPAATE